MPFGPAARHHSARVLEIVVRTDNSDNDIEQIEAVTYYRGLQSRAASNGFTPDAVAASSEVNAPLALGTALNTVANGEVFIWFSEVLPPVNVIVLNHTTQT